MGAPYSYKDYYLCAHGCGEQHGWIKHGEEHFSVIGRMLCPYCHRGLRTKSRWKH